MSLRDSLISQKQPAFLQESFLEGQLVMSK